MGLFSPGDHIITTVSEHNSVLRPLYEMEGRGITVTHLAVDEAGRLLYDKLEESRTEHTRAVVVTHASNLTGNVTDLGRVSEFAGKYGLKLITIKDLIAYRLQRESLITVGQTVDMPTEYGHFKLIPFRQTSSGLEHIALIKGEWREDEAILVRVHSSCATGDILGSKRCDCGQQLHKAMQMIEKEGKGVLIYMQQEGRGIGLMNKIEAYKLQEEGYDTVDANVHLGFKPDERDYGCGAQMLRHLGVHKMRLMTNNPTKRVGLEAYGLEIVENVPIEITPNEYDYKYLKTKKDRMGHTLHL